MDENVQPDTLLGTYTPDFWNISYIYINISYIHILDGQAHKSKIITIPQDPIEVTLRKVFHLLT